ncbi:hypothetical protein ACFSQ7_36710 [Paenibacillus rhizoplanae]
MKSSSGAMPLLLNYLAKGFVILFALPVLGVWVAGSFICAVIAPIAGLLRTFGVSAIGMNLTPSYSVPVILSLPFSLVLAFLLLLSFYYTRRLLRKKSKLHQVAKRGISAAILRRRNTPFFVQNAPYLLFSLFLVCEARPTNEAQTAWQSCLRAA